MKAPPLSSRLAVVTGGTRGIGRATAECLRASGVHVLVTGTKPDGKAPDGCDYYAVDFQDPDETTRFATHLTQCQPLILVNNAGVTRPQSFADIDPEEVRRVHQINLTAPIQLCTAVLGGMRKGGWGRIVNVSSIWSVVGRTGRATYSSTKGGLNAMTRALSVEVAREGILANCVAPGFIDTDLLRAATTETDRESLRDKVPMGRLGTVEEIAVFIAWLCSDQNTYITGQTLVIDGGYCAV